MSSEQDFFSITKAAKILNVSTETLRRWDRSGKLKAIRTPGRQRRYSITLLKNFAEENLFLNAKWWALKGQNKPNEIFYCPTRPVFEARNAVMEKLLKKEIGEAYSIISSSVGEIGNNSFDHNVGKWPDTPGIFFGYDFKRRQIILADRGQGIRKTLQHVVATPLNHQEALTLAFTEVITGRAPEKRGNGLKYVRRNSERGYFSLIFQTGDIELSLNAGEPLSSHHIKTIPQNLQGCFALITF
jgi:excisionase family DNA binding protein